MTTEQDEIADIRREFVRGLTDRLIAIRESAHAYENQPSEENAKRLGTLTHRLRGTAGAFGFDDLGDLARAIDATLIAPIDWDQAWAAVSALAVAVERIARASS